MNTVLIIVMVIFATIGICTVAERLYAFSKRFRDRIKIRRGRIADILILNNNVAVIFKRLTKVEKRITKLEGNRLPVDNSFRHFVDKFEKLERVIEVHRVSLKGLDDVQLIHAHSISKLEKAKK